MFTILNEQKFQDIVDTFTVCKAEIEEIAASFRRDLEMGINDDELSSLQMLKSYISLPTGNEKGEFLTLDFGGTNVRVLLVRLFGEGKFEILKKVMKPLAFPGVYDFIGKDATAEDLFDFIAGMIDEVIDENHKDRYLLGHTFSFPSEQNNLNDAKLIAWTKEFATQDVEGKMINALLRTALKKNGIENVEPIAIINDTVAVLLAGAYRNESVYIGSICGTGHNTAYLEPYIGQAIPRMIVNLESGGFNKLLPNKYDRVVDQCSEKPGEQRLEKMVSGKYLGKLFSLALADGIGGENKIFEFDTIDLSVILGDNSSSLQKVHNLLLDKIGVDFDIEDCEWIKAIAESIVIRSARLIVSTYLGVIWHRDTENINQQTIVIDGSLYEKMPMYAEAMKKAFYEVLGEQSSQVTITLENNGSGIGAAIAAAIAENI